MMKIIFYNLVTSEEVRKQVVYLPWASHLHHIDIEGADGDGGPDGGHEGPGVHPGVPQVHHQVVIPALRHIIYLACHFLQKKYTYHDRGYQTPSRVCFKFSFHRQIFFIDSVINKIVKFLCGVSIMFSCQPLVQ